MTESQMQQPGQSLSLPAGYAVRAPEPEDAPEIVDLISAIELETTGASEITLADFLGDWEGVDLLSNAVVVLGPDGCPAAYADLAPRGNVIFFLYGYVHPFQRAKGLGSYLLAWGENRALTLAASAPAESRIAIRVFANERAAPARALLVKRGYEPVRVTHTMAIDLDRKPPDPVWPPGIAVRQYVRGADDHPAYEAFEEAFADSWQRPRGTFEEFASRLRRPYFDPKLWFLAMDGDEIAGTLFASEIEGKGWIEIVGVRRRWRRRGLALAMLHHAFGAFLSRGVTHIGLSVDAENPTGAPRLYARAGMRLDQRFFVYERELRPGFAAAGAQSAP